MITVKIRTQDYKKIKDGGYIEKLSRPHWFYHTENDLAIVEKEYGIAWLHVAKNKEEYEEFIKTIIDEKKEYDAK